MTTCAPRQVQLDDGRQVWCTRPAEARLLWRELSGDGSYRRAAAGLRDGDTVLDVGANIGLASLVFAAAAPNVRVIAAEPVPDLFACLERNLAGHVPSGRAVRLAVGAAPGALPFT